MVGPERNQGTFPTYSHYEDRGCEPALPSCLSCPLPLCRYDDERGYANWKRRQQRAKVRTSLQFVKSKKE